MNQKIDLVGHSSYFEEEYENVESVNAYSGTHLQKHASKVERDIAKLQAKQAILHHFLQEQQLEQKQNVMFNQIQKTICTHHWKEQQAIVDNQNLIDEELCVFNIQTDQCEILILMEYVGNENLIQRRVYRLHTPLMSQKHFELVKEAVLNQLERKEHMILLHGTASIEEEQNKLFVSLLCQEDFVLTRWKDGHDYEIKLAKGKEYTTIPHASGLYVKCEEDDEFIYLYSWDAEVPFGEDFKKDLGKRI